MGLFFEVLESLNHPALRGTVARLEAVIREIQRVAAEQGIAADETPRLLALVGDVVRSHVRQGDWGMDAASFAIALHPLPPLGGQDKALAIVPPAMQAEIAEKLTGQAGVPAERLPWLLPGLVGGVVQLLALGAPGASGAKERVPDNPIVQAFLESDRPAEVDMGALYQAALRFLEAQVAIAPAPKKAWFRR